MIFLTGIFFFFSTDGFPKTFEKTEKTYSAKFSVTQQTQSQQNWLANFFER